MLPDASQADTLSVGHQHAEAGCFADLQTNKRTVTWFGVRRRGPDFLKIGFQLVEQIVVGGDRNEGHVAVEQR